MSKKINIMSISLEPEMHDLLKVHAKKKKIPVSEFVRSWLDKYPFNGENVIPVVLDVPEHLTRDRDSLASFLAKKSQIIVSALCG